MEVIMAKVFARKNTCEVCFAFLDKKLTAPFILNTSILQVLHTLCFPYSFQTPDI